MQIVNTIESRACYAAEPHTVRTKILSDPTPDHQNKVVAEINEMSCFQAQTREESWLDLWAGGRRWDGIS